MKTYDNGAFFTVTISRVDVQAFKDNWPGSSLPDRPLYAQFDKSNGDLVDHSSDDYDGDDLAALVQDAQNYGAKKLNLPEHCYRK